MAGPRDRQQVALDGATDRLVAEGDDPVDLDDEPVVERLGQTGADVGVEDAVAVARPARRPRGRAVGLGLERLRDIGQLLGGQRQAGRRHQPQHATALGRSRREAGDDQLVERPTQRGVRQFATGGQ